jgi:periplasmic mercuric ion binding protein
MRLHHAAAAGLTLVLSLSAALAADRTVVLSVHNANCELCAPIVKRSLARVAGVKAVDVKQEDQMADPVATISFDDAITNVSALIAATTNAGYPSRLAN